VLATIFEADPMEFTVMWKLIARLVTPASKRTCARLGRFLGAAIAPFLLGVAIIMSVPAASRGGVLSESDFKRVETVKPLFQSLMVDLVQTSKRTDISASDAECVTSTMRELLQISEELSSYEYLITIEKEINDAGESSPVKGVVKFAIEKTSTILAEERKRLAQLSDRCSRFPLGFGKTQQALQFIDTTSNLLNSIQVRP
jgi:hypothetical protein